MLNRQVKSFVNDNTIPMLTLILFLQIITLSMGRISLIFLPLTNIRCRHDIDEAPLPYSFIHRRATMRKRNRFIAATHAALFYSPRFSATFAVCKSSSSLVMLFMSFLITLRLMVTKMLCNEYCTAFKQDWLMFIFLIYQSIHLLPSRPHLRIRGCTHSLRKDFAIVRLQPARLPSATISTSA